jgi:hypothetical protein
MSTPYRPDRGQYGVLLTRVLEVLGRSRDGRGVGGPANGGRGDPETPGVPGPVRPTRRSADIGGSATRPR